MTDPKTYIGKSVTLKKERMGVPKDVPLVIIDAWYSGIALDVLLEWPRKVVRLTRKEKETVEG